MLGINSLQGLTITYTRSHTHWQRFAPYIKSLGANAIHMPLLELASMRLPTAKQIAIKQADCLVFTSVNAVDYFFTQGLSIKPDQQITSIGQQTTAALQQQLADKKLTDIQIITAPPPYDSEALLSVFSPHQQSIVIIAAPRGRKYLFQQLAKHNQVDFAYVYQRHCHAISASVIEQSLQAQITLITSCSSLDCLMENYPHESLKLIQYKTCIAGISAKVANYALDLGFQHTFHAQEASEHALIDAVAHWWSINKELE